MSTLSLIVALNAVGIKLTIVARGLDALIVVGLATDIMEDHGKYIVTAFFIAVLWQLGFDSVAIGLLSFAVLVRG